MQWTYGSDPLSAWLAALSVLIAALFAIRRIFAMHRRKLEEYEKLTKDFASQRGSAKMDEIVKVLSQNASMLDSLYGLLANQHRSAFNAAASVGMSGLIVGACGVALAQLGRSPALGLSMLLLAAVAEAVSLVVAIQAWALGKESRRLVAKVISFQYLITSMANAQTMEGREGYLEKVKINYHLRFLMDVLHVPDRRRDVMGLIQSLRKSSKPFEVGISCELCGNVYPSNYWFKDEGRTKRKLCIDCEKTLSAREIEEFMSAEAAAAQ